MMKRMARERKEIILEELDFGWTRREKNLAKDMWNEGKPIDEMARIFNRKPDEVFMLLFELARKGRIQERPGWIYGKNQKSAG